MVESKWCKIPFLFYFLENTLELAIEWEGDVGAIIMEEAVLEDAPEANEDNEVMESFLEPMEGVGVAGGVAETDKTDERSTLEDMSSMTCSQDSGRVPGLEVALLNF
jgi:hypothetical protein